MPRTDSYAFCMHSASAFCAQTHAAVWHVVSSQGRRTAVCVCVCVQVENPIPFIPDLSARVLNTGYLHARYARLLVWSKDLSADWSYACVPLVNKVSLCDVFYTHTHTHTHTRTHTDW